MLQPVGSMLFDRVFVSRCYVLDACVISCFRFMNVFGVVNHVMGVKANMGKALVMCGCRSTTRVVAVDWYASEMSGSLTFPRLDRPSMRVCENSVSAQAVGAHIHCFSNFTFASPQVAKLCKSYVQLISAAQEGSFFL